MSQDSRRESLGWTPWFEAQWNTLVYQEASTSQGEGKTQEPGTTAARFPARVVGEERGLRRLQASPLESFWGEPTGKARLDPDLFPAIGDWVVCSRGATQERASIHAVLPRRTCLARVEAGRSGRPQVLAANVDVGFVVTSLNADLNPRRIERYLATIWDGGARPVVLLTKRDLCDDPDCKVAEIERVAAGADVLAVSSVTGKGIEALEAHLRPGETAVLLGSSGAGKSTLINRLLGKEAVPTQPIRESDDRGRHTTTSRHLWILGSGALVIDTPGLRELQLFVDEASLDLAFDDLRELALGCRFTDCRHRSEPGCAVRGALENGSLAEERLAAYDKLTRELAFQTRKADKAKASAEKARWKKLSKLAQERSRQKRWV